MGWVVDVSGQNAQVIQNELESQVAELIKDKSDAPAIAKIIQSYKTKQGVNNGLTRQFRDGKKTSEIYNAIKPLIADKKGR